MSFANFLLSIQKYCFAAPSAFFFVRKWEKLGLYKGAKGCLPLKPNPSQESGLVLTTG